MATTQFTLINSATVGSGGASSVTFSSIPNTYTDLKVLMSVRTSWGNIGDWGSVRFNGDTGNNYSYLYAQGAGTSTVYSIATNGNHAEISAGWAAVSSTSGVFSNTELYIPNYTSSNTKSFSGDTVEENNSSTAWMNIEALLWNNTAAINSITLASANGATIQQYSTFYLYGIKNS